LYTHTTTQRHIPHDLNPITNNNNNNNNATTSNIALLIKHLEPRKIYAKSRGVVREYNGGLPHTTPPGQHYTYFRTDCRAVIYGTETPVKLIQSHNYCL
jgi:hypothetical protein